MDREDLIALAGVTGDDVLKGTQAAVNDLEQAGITAKDGAAGADEAGAPEDTAKPEAEAVADKAKPDLAAMRDAIDKLAKEQSPAEPDPVNAELVQLREMVGAMRQEISELKGQIDAQAQVQAKSAAVWKEVTDRMATIEKEHGQAVDVVTGLYDVVMDFYTGKKEGVVERSGSGSPHDPEGVQLQRQIEQMTGPAPHDAGQYAADRVFGSN